MRNFMDWNEGHIFVSGCISSCKNWSAVRNEPPPTSPSIQHLSQQQSQREIQGVLMEIFVWLKKGFIRNSGHRWIWCSAIMGFQLAHFSLWFEIVVAWWQMKATGKDLISPYHLFWMGWSTALWWCFALGWSLSPRIRNKSSVNIL